MEKENMKHSRQRGSMGKGPKAVGLYMFEELNKDHCEMG